MRIAVVGLQTIGAGLASALVERGHAVVVWDADEARLQGFARRHLGRAVQPAPDLPALVGATAPPRLVVVDEAPGEGVDEILAGLRPLLARGDVIAHAGVEAPARTAARAEALEATGVGYLGIGVGGDEATVAHGPALFVGGTQRAALALESVLGSIAARAGDGATAMEWVGPDGAGHLAQAAIDALVVMDLQLLVEACDLLRLTGDAPPDELAGIVGDWAGLGQSRGELSGPLLSAASRVLATYEGSGATRPMVDRVLDLVEGSPARGPVAGARLASAEATTRGVPSALLASALEARALGAAKHERQGAARVLAGPIPGQRYTESRTALVENVRDAYGAARWVAAALVVDLLERSTTAQGGSLRLGAPALFRLARTGTLVGGPFAGRVAEAAERIAGGRITRSILLDTEVAQLLRDRQVGWRNAVALGVQHGVALPALAAALATYDGLRRDRHPVYLTAAVENALGLGDFRRTDREGAHHHEWTSDDD